MKEILEILSEDLTLGKALRIRESKKSMDKRWIKNSLIPATLCIAIFCIVGFSFIVVCGIMDGTLDVENTEELESTGVAMMFLVVGTILGMTIRQSEDTSAVNRIVDPVIEDAIDKLAEETGDEEDAPEQNP